MAFARPTLADLVARIKNDFVGQLSLLGPLLRRAMAEISAIVWAGAAHEMHGHLDWLSLQLFATTAEHQYLLIIGGPFIGGLLPASFAAGPIIATGVNGTIIPEDTIWVRGDGFAYRQTADATIASGTATVSVVATVAGEDGNAAEGETVALESPILDIDSNGEVGVGGIAGGFEEEDTEAYRTRLLLHFREPPEGGADQDYVAWALEVPGVTRAWPSPNENGLGTVVVRFMMDDLPDPFPTGPAVAIMQAKLEEERPITAEVTAEAPTPLDVAFTIQVVPNTAAVKAAVEAELVDLFRREAEPGDGSGGGTVELSKIRTAIGIAEGLEDYTLTVPSANVVPALGELAVKGLVTWV